MKDKEKRLVSDVRNILRRDLHLLAQTPILKKITLTDKEIIQMFLDFNKKHK